MTRRFASFIALLLAASNARTVGKALLYTLMAACLAASAHATNIVLNPGFDTGDFTDWTVNPGTGHWQIFGVSQGGGPNPPGDTPFATLYECGDQSGSCLQPDFNSSTPQGNWMFQDLATVVGATYSLSFFYDPGSTSFSGFPFDFAELQAMWNGTVVDDLTFSNQGDLGYVQFTVPNLVATSSTTRLAFLGQRAPAANPGFSTFDTVDVEETAPPPPPSPPPASAPEPSALLLTGGGLLAIARVLRGKWRDRHA